MDRLAVPHVSIAVHNPFSQHFSIKWANIREAPKLKRTHSLGDLEWALSSLYEVNFSYQVSPGRLLKLGLLSKAKEEILKLLSSCKRKLQNLENGYVNNRWEVESETRSLIESNDENKNVVYFKLWRIKLPYPKLHKKVQIKNNAQHEIARVWCFHQKI